MMQSYPDILEADGIHLSFDGRTILSSIYIRCETGKVTGLLGRNGEGKTCLMNIIYGRLQAESSSVRLNEGHLRDAWKQPHRLRFAPQFHFIPAAFTLRRVFSDLEVNFLRFCEFFPEFEGCGGDRLGSLSGGHRRLVEIYTILCSQTMFVLLDEPFSHVMPVHVETLLKVIRREKADKGILLSDHLYSEVVGASDDLYMLTGGNLAAVPEAEELRWEKASEG